MVRKTKGEQPRELVSEYQVFTGNDALHFLSEYANKDHFHIEIEFNIWLTYIGFIIPI